MQSISKFINNDQVYIILALMSISSYINYNNYNDICIIK